MTLLELTVVNRGVNGIVFPINSRKREITIGRLVSDLVYLEHIYISEIGYHSGKYILEYVLIYFGKCILIRIIYALYLLQSNINN